MLQSVSCDEFICDKDTTCCITGHRNRDLPFGGNVHKQGMKCLLSMFQLLIDEAYADGYRTFISGMAEGVDLACAGIIHNLIVSGRYPDMHLVCALPYEEQYRELSLPLDRYSYSMILDGCDEKVVVSSKDDKNRYKLRNSFMVKNSSRIIGAYKHKVCGSGTLQTINMAKRAGLDMQIISLDNNPVLYCDTDNDFDLTDFARFVP